MNLHLAIHNLFNISKQKIGPVKYFNFYVPTLSLVCLFCLNIYREIVYWEFFFNIILLLNTIDDAAAQHRPNETVI